MNKFAIAAITSAAFIGGRITQFPETLSSVPEPQIVLPAEVLDVHDGDTLKVSVSQVMSVRLLDCWSKELKDGGEPAKQNLLKKCPIGSKVVLRVPIEPDISRMFTFGRVLGYIYKDNENLSEVQVNDGFATKKKPKTN